MKMPRITVLLCVLTLLAACSKDNYQSSDISSDKAVALNVSVSGVTEASEGDAAATSRSTAAAQTVITPLDKGLSMEATLTPNNIVTRSTTSLAAGVTYRIIAFKQGNVSSAGYISYADFAVGGATTSNTFVVPAYGLYTFVCYSLNSTAMLPAFDKNSLDPTITSGSDLLYRKFDQYISAAASSCKLSIVFRHLLPSVTVVADVSSQAVSAISATFSPGYNALLSLSAGTLSASGSSSTYSIPWGTITSGQALTSTPFRIFTNGGAISIAVPSVTISGTTYTNRTASFSSISGTGNYIMRLKFNNTSNPGTSSEGITIAGLTWAPGNLTGGADGNGGYSYHFASTQEYYSDRYNGGDYWNWLSLSPFDYQRRTLIDYDAAYDPCTKVAPVGTWRMPSTEEFQTIINTGSTYTTKNHHYGRYFGTSSVPVSGTENNYLFLPHAGWRDSDACQLYLDAGSYGIYMSKDRDSGGLRNPLYLYINANNGVGIAARGISVNEGYTIRCISTTNPR